MSKRGRQFGHIVTEETRRKIGLANLGNKYSLGRKLSEETKIKIGLVHKGKKHTEEHKRKISLGNMGKKMSEEFRRKISLAHRGKPKPNQSGSKCNLWKGGIDPINHKIRNSLEYKLWRDACFSRDGYTCQKTGEKGVFLVVHHILNFSSHPELRFSIDNGITLSKKSHLDFHNKYGRKNNNRNQLEEFLTNM